MLSAKHAIVVASAVNDTKIWCLFGKIAPPPPQYGTIGRHCFQPQIPFLRICNLFYRCIQMSSSTFLSHRLCILCSCRVCVLSAHVSAVVLADNRSKFSSPLLLHLFMCSSRSINATSACTQNYDDLSCNLSTYKRFVLRNFPVSLVRATAV
jgi:hypothetical protein